MDSIKIGEVVRSKQGRDAGRLFLVIGIINGEYVQLIDGELRKLGNEKLKKTKHIKPIFRNLPELTAKIAGGSYVNNSDIRKALAEVEMLISKNTD